MQRALCPVAQNIAQPVLDADLAGYCSTIHLECLCPHVRAFHEDHSAAAAAAAAAEMAAVGSGIKEGGVLAKAGLPMANDPLLADALVQLAPQLREYLRAQLPPALVPAAIVVMPTLPMTSNGKIDRGDASP